MHINRQMKNGGRKQSQSNVLKIIFIVSMIVAIGFPLLSIKYIYPSFTNLMIKNIENDAIRTGNYISGMLMKYKESLANKSLSDDFFVEISNIVRSFDLMKLKIFLPSGEVIYSTDDKDIGKINEKSYFHEIVSKGETYSKIVKKGGKSQEGKILSLDVIEIYVPKMIAGQFDGAYEFYYDITAETKEINQVVLWSSIIPLIVMFIFLAVIVAIIVKADTPKVESPMPEKSLRYQSPYYSMAMATISIIIAEIIAMYVVHSFNRLSEVQMMITDIIILIMLIAPSIYFFFVQPLMKYTSTLMETQKELSHELSERKNAEQELHQMAYYDQLTSLPNRANFLSYLERMLKRTKWNSNYLFAVLFIDLDRFKLINDSLGHLIGDKLLIEIAHRLETCTRPTDRISRAAGNNRVSRFGGDEFALFLNDVKDISSASRVADRIQKALQKPFNLDGHELFTSASIGIAMSATGYKNAEDILRDADSAMYRAKATGRARAEIFDDEMHVRVTQILQFESDLRTAVEKEQFMVYYQPIVSARDSRITGTEALIRWKHPEQGFISPMDFIPIAEETGLISTIGEWVLRTACAQNKAWQDAGYQHLLMKVNFSSRQFKDENLTEMVKRVLRETNMPAQLLDVEITESIAMADDSIRILNHLTAMGLQTSVDDFGTGYSSLSSLTRFPVNTIKIDRAFIKDITTDVTAQAIIKAIIAMAHSLKIEVIAEGVETEDQLAFLQSQGCDKIQGYLFSRPVPEEEFRKLLEQDKVGPSPVNKHSASLV